MQPLSVLVVDANQRFLRSTVRYLAETQPGVIDVVGAVTCLHEALAQAAALRPEVVLVGLSRPVAAALALITELCRSSPCRVVAMGQLGSAGYAQAALAAGAAIFVDTDRLQSELALALQQGALRQRGGPDTCGQEQNA